jgi:PAS domain S-box-containing protein
VLEILLKTVEADRIQIIKNMIDQDGRICMAKTYEACASGVSFKVKDYNLNLVPYDNGFSRWHKFFSQRQVILGPIDSFPTSEQLILKENNIHSIIALPIWVNGQLDGFIALHDLHSPRRWSNEVISFLQTSIDMIGAFLGAQQSTEKLRREQDKLQALVDSANDIIYTISMETERFEYISPGWRPLLGHDPDEVIGTSFKDYVHPDDIEKCQIFLERLMVTGDPQSGVEYRVQHKNGSWRWHMSNAGPLKDDQGRPALYVGIARDITYKKELEKLREDVDRMVHHDLKTPLNGIIGLSELLNSRYNLSEEQRELVMLIEDRGRYMLEMLNQSLNFYKIEAGTYHYKPEYVDLIDLLRNIIIGMAKSIEIKFFVNRKCVTRNDTLFILAEDFLLKSIFSNLLINAVEASPTNGVVKVDIIHNKETKVVISNQGEVPAEMRDRFFEKYATQGKKDGTGLGTYIARLMVDVIGGEISLNALEKETQVVVSFPN